MTYPSPNYSEAIARERRAPAEYIERRFIP